MAESSTSRFAPWSGLVAGAAAWAADHQALSDGLHFACVSDERQIGLVAGAIAAALTIAGGAVSLRVLRRRSLASGARFVAIVSTLAAAVFLLAIMLQTVATQIVPGCGA